MTGFKNFLLRGNLIEIAVAFIMASYFGAVVKAFVDWFTSYIPGLKDAVKGTSPGAVFVNSVIAFVIIAAVVYFLVVVPYTKAKERFFPREPEGTPADVALLTEIRDLLSTRPL